MTFGVTVIELEKQRVLTLTKNKKNLYIKEKLSPEDVWFDFSMTFVKLDTSESITKKSITKKWKISFSYFLPYTRELSPKTSDVWE